MEAGKSGLLNLLSNHEVTFFIPPYQRNYEWQQEQCKAFLADIMKTAKIENSGHFFGTVLYFQIDSIFGEPTKLILVDGQQRLTTTMLFLAALRDVIDDSKVEELINNRYLINQNVTDEKHYKIKLKQVETDLDAYVSIILKKELTSENKKSHVFKNYAYFRKELVKIKNDDKVELTDLIDKGLGRFTIVTIELQPKEKPWENPQEIFESMNSIGKPLSLADLVRNYLLLGKNDKQQEALYQDFWLPLEKTLPDYLPNFFRDLMQFESSASYKKATDNNHKELYSEFKKLFGTYDSPDILKQFKNYSPLYATIIGLATSENDGIDKKSKDLHSIEATTSYSFILGLLVNQREDKLSFSEVIDCLEVLNIYLLRRRIIGLTNHENKMFPQLGKEFDSIINAKDKKQVMFDILSNQDNAGRLPNDIELARYMKEMNFYSFKQGKLILQLVEEKITKSRPAGVQIEHIMPQKLTDEWKKMLGPDFEEIHQQYIHNIGNLTLIRHNQELSNKPFQDKKELYKDNSGMQISKDDIIDCDEWTAETIKNRQEKLVQFILEKIIPIPQEKRRSNNFITKSNNGLSFTDLELIGQEIHYRNDESIVSKVINDKEVEFEGKTWKLSPLTKEIETRKGTVRKSGAYRGAVHWCYNGTLLKDL